MPATPTATYTSPSGAVIERWDNPDPKRPERITVKRPKAAGCPPVLCRVFTYRTTAEADTAWQALVPTNVTPLRRPRRTKK